MFNDRQVKQLQAKLDRGLIAQRKQGGTNVSYIEGYAAIEAANRIFGYGNWQGRIVSMTKVDEREVKRESKTGWYVGYTCEYEVTVFSDDGSRSITFTDIGYGSSTTYTQFGDAVESATKEAATDAMKRTLRNFGNQFGLALYDKQKRNVTDTAGFNVDAARDVIINHPAATIDDAREALLYSTQDELRAIYREIAARKVEAPQEQAEQPELAAA